MRKCGEEGEGVAGAFKFMKEKCFERYKAKLVDKNWSKMLESQVSHCLME